MIVQINKQSKGDNAMKTINFKISELEYTINFLFNLELVDTASRMRSRFIKLLNERYEQFKNEHLELLNKYVSKDESGLPKKTIENDQEVFVVEDMKNFNKEYFDLLNEDFFIDINHHTEKMVHSVTHSVLNCGLSFKGQESIDYDLLCEKFENYCD